jgi:hypothetical protein
MRCTLGVATSHQGGDIVTFSFDNRTKAIAGSWLIIEVLTVVYNPA